MSILSTYASIIQKWDLRGFVLITLFLQTLLLFVAPFRKQTSSTILLGVVWVAYIGSDWASNYAVGLIVAANMDQKQPISSPGPGSDILMFWAPFLLLHLGGADSISALSSIDNELWARFAIQLATMSFGIANAFYRSFLESRLRVPVLLLFVAGFTKYVERLLSLFQARFSALRESMVYEKKKSPNKPLELNCTSYELSDAEMVRDAFRLFKLFKMLYVDLQINPEDRRRSREYFQNRSSREAFRVVEIELNFSYDLFFTKGSLIRQGLGRFLRPLCIICEVATLVLWFRIDKGGFKKFDVYATYALLLGAVARDFISIATMIRSDCLSLRKLRWDDYSNPKEAPMPIYVSRALLRHWSESISQLNFITVNFENDFEEDNAIFDGVMKYRVLSKKWFSNGVREFIFQELSKRASGDNICERTRGEWSLENYKVPRHQELLSVSGTYVSSRTFDESLLMWHIATDLCYRTQSIDVSISESEQESRQFSKLVSNYMMFLLLGIPEMMLEVAAMGDMRFEETQKEAKWSFNNPSLYNGDETLTINMGCELVLRDVQNTHPRDIGNSVWYHACRLAIKLKELEENRVINMWELIAKVWVEMLSYGAAQCSPSAHAAQLAQGGQLITLVWLLMEHLGLGRA